MRKIKLKANKITYMYSFYSGVITKQNRLTK